MMWPEDTVWRAERQHQAAGCQWRCQCNSPVRCKAYVVIKHSCLTVCEVSSCYIHKLVSQYQGHFEGTAGTLQRLTILCQLLELYDKHIQY